MKITRYFSFALSAFFTILFFTGIAFADSSKTTTHNECSVRDKSDTVIIMVCSTSSQEHIQQAAKKACGTNHFCNVWVWDDELLAPKAAPAIGVDIPKISTGKAIAIWINDSDMLISLRHLKK